MHGKAKRIFWYSIGIFLAIALLVEVGSTLILFYKHKDEMWFYFNTAGMSSTQILLYQICLTRGACEVKTKSKITYTPGHLFGVDDSVGYHLKPGRYEVMYEKNHSQNQTDVFKHIVRINGDGTRYVGEHAESASKQIYILGDSFVFGEGVNDEQTFSYLLQGKFKNYKVKNLAVSGYGTVQAYLQFRRIKHAILPEDLVILGYADWHKERNVAAPSRLRQYGEPSSDLGEGAKHPKASIRDDGTLRIDLIPIYCKFNRDYCAQRDPSKEEMDEVTKKLLGDMAKEVQGLIAVLHFAGPKSDPDLTALPPNVKVIPATNADFDYKIDDTIMEFDHHPGPFWHYAIYSQIASWISANYH
jgi:hypothetical protein